MELYLNADWVMGNGMSSHESKRQPFLVLKKTRYVKSQTQIFSLVLPAEVYHQDTNVTGVYTTDSSGLAKCFWANFR